MPDPVEADEQGELRRAVDGVCADLGLDDELPRLGVPVLVGSAALGVMVARDIDLTVTVEALTPGLHDQVAGYGARLLSHPRVRQVLLRDDTGPWNQDPAYPDGLYLGLKYRAPDARDWNLDVWFVDQPERQPDLRHLRTLLPRLTPETRAAIVAIKRELLARPGAGRPPSVEVYHAVLDHGARTPADVDRLRAER